LLSGEKYVRISAEEKNFLVQKQKQLYVAKIREKQNDNSEKRSVRRTIFFGRIFLMSI
jgi:hypothetical protein